ncbi:MAG: hypothetical protein ABIE84_01445, partial [bacterium]
MNKSGMRKAFFGLEPKSIRSLVVISPIIYPTQFEKVYGQAGKHEKSILSYLIANYRDLTFIKTPMTQAAVSDLVVLLKGTKCKRIVFLGAIGGLSEELEIGDVVTVENAGKIKSVSSIHEETTANLKKWKKAGYVGLDFETEAFFSV